MKLLYYIFGLLLLFTSCDWQENPTHNGAFTAVSSNDHVNYDLDHILNVGELIVGTMSGPNSYYEYQGQPMGLQYALVSHFARKNGLRVRIELSHNEAELIHQLANEEIDIICYPLSDSLIVASEFIKAGYRDDSLSTSWSVRSSSPLLKQALDDWFGNGIIVRKEKLVQTVEESHHPVRRHSKAPFLSRENGIISTYDEYFRNAARIVGWDWRLLAAQCYQESGFDPEAVSWAGAKGLMQIMPFTAEQVGLPPQQIYQPRENIFAGVRYLQILNEKFSDIKDLSEKTKFVLAAYNGGAGHVRDAMALTQKYGGNPKKWTEVAPYLIKLSQEKYYRDPLVKHGYMVGDETYHYVYDILDRWYAYGGVIIANGYYADSSGKKITRRKNRFTEDVKIYHPGDLELKYLKE